jgi:tRNA-splicing endonuclease subunit Sen34
MVDVTVPSGISSTANSNSDPKPFTAGEPFPIYHVSGKYFLFDVEHVDLLRRKHHMTGTLIGNLPQATQQNVYSGLPLLLMPEEARLLIEQGQAYIVDDVDRHKTLYRDLSPEQKAEYQNSLRQEGLKAAEEALRKHMESKVKYWKKQSKDGASGSSLSSKPGSAFTPRSPSSPSLTAVQSGEQVSSDETLFDSPELRQNLPVVQEEELQPMHVTLTTSSPPFPRDGSASSTILPEVPSSYPLYAHLHSKGYYVSPGLRFGCQYMAYPGDPLRFHSHFLADGMRWDDEIDLMEIVGGGRLGTGVKKAYLIGGRDEEKAKEGVDHDDVRAFSFEWAVM